MQWEDVIWTCKILRSNSQNMENLTIFPGLNSRTLTCVIVGYWVAMYPLQVNILSEEDSSWIEPPWATTLLVILTTKNYLRIILC